MTASLMSLLLGCGEVDPSAGGTEQSRRALGGSELLSPFARRALVLSQLSTVNDPKRTYDPCKKFSPPGANNKWTFGYLMTQATNQSSTGVTPSNFVKSWVQSFANPPVIGPDQPSPTGPGALTGKQIDGDWKFLSNSTTTYQMMAAPFRLLAIVPRFDLRKNRRFGEGNAGELRFVFGQVRGPNARLPEPGTGNCTTADGTTIILEYAVNRADENAVQAWAKAWQNLLRIDDTTEAYRQAVEDLVDPIVKAGAGSGRPNSSNLIRLRTNAIPSATPPPTWDMREWAIDGTSHLLVSTRVKQSPRMVLIEGSNPPSGTEEEPAPPFDSTRIGDWINSHQTAILNDNYVVPNTFPGTNVSFLGGLNLNIRPHNRSVYASNIFSPEARHLFSKGTCLGCHATEVGPYDAHFHIAPRDSNVESTLSDFLTGGGEGQTVQVPDPIYPGIIRSFNEVGSREKDVIALTNGQPVVPVARSVPITGEPSVAGQNYKVLVQAANLCIAGNGTSNGTQMRLVACDGTSGQRLMLEEQTSGAYRVRIKSSSKCMERTSTGKLVQQTCDGAKTAQNVNLWRLDPDGTNYLLYFAISHGIRCIGKTTPLVDAECLFDGGSSLSFIE